MGFVERVRNGWNAFRNRDPTMFYREPGMSYTYRPDRVRFSRGNEKSIVTSVYNRIAMDVAAIDVKHCRVDKNGRFIEEIGYYNPVSEPKTFKIDNEKANAWIAKGAKPTDVIDKLFKEHNVYESVKVEEAEANTEE